MRAQRSVTLQHLLTGLGQLGATAVLVVLALSALKGALIALEFMELRTAPALWRWLVMGWMVVVLGLIAVVTTR